MQYYLLLMCYPNNLVLSFDRLVYLHHYCCYKALNAWLIYIPRYSSK
ncbi:unnamed protein product, partial [Ectocarpus sp. 4 AP-2014]